MCYNDLTTSSNDFCPQIFFFVPLSLSLSLKAAKVLRFVGFAKVWCFSSGNAIGFCGGCVFIGCSGDVYCSGFGLGIGFCGGCGLGVLLMVLESTHEAPIS